MNETVIYKNLIEFIQQNLEGRLIILAQNFFFTFEGTKTLPQFFLLIHEIFKKNHDPPAAWRKKS